MRDAIVGASSRLTGRLTGRGQVRIDGALQGEVDLDGALDVSRGAEVDAPVSVERLSLDGTVRGDVTASAEAALGADARLDGTLTTPRATVHPSATIRGRLSMPLDLPRGVGQARRRR